MATMEKCVVAPHGYILKLRLRIDSVYKSCIVFMSPQVVISNRQRKLHLDLPWLKDAVGLLCEEICKNLRDYPAVQLMPGFLSTFEISGSLSLVLVSNDQIRKLNKKWRLQDNKTDVLSFPLALEPPLAGFPWEVGEIFISVEQAKEQGITHGHGFERELAFLFVHGVLHVLGFDHETANQEKEMFSRQQDILDAAGFPR